MAVSQFLAKMPSKAWYVGGWKRVVALAKVEPDAVVRDPFDQFGGEVRVGKLRDEMRAALDRRINMRGGAPAANVPLDAELLREAHQVNEMAAARAAGRGVVRVYRWHSKAASRRFGHLLSDRSEA